MADNDWVAWAQNLASSWGLSAGIANTILDLVNKGFANEALVLELRKSPEYVARFPAMGTMVQRGWTEQNYVSYEQKMREMETTYGLPQGMLSSPDQVAKMAVANLDEAQVEKRVKINYAAAKQVPSEVRQAMADYYGVTDVDGALAAYYLDPNRSVELLQDQLLTSQIGGAGKRYGIEVQRQEAERLAQQGITDQEAMTGFQRARALDSLTTGLGDQETVSMEDLAAAQFGGVDQAKQVARAAGSRIAEFKGGGGATDGERGASGLASSSS